MVCLFRLVCAGLFVFDCCQRGHMNCCVNDRLSLRSLQSHSALIQQIPQDEGSRFDVYALTDSARMF